MIPCFRNTACPIEDCPNRNLSIGCPPMTAEQVAQATSYEDAPVPAPKEPYEYRAAKRIGGNSRVGESVDRDDYYPFPNWME